MPFHCDEEWKVLGTSGAEWERLGAAPGRSGRWVFEGFTSLMPIYEPMDGAEVLWSEFPNITIGALRRRVKPKGKLEVFED
jgi:hypothetical protein